MKKSIILLSMIFGLFAMYACSEDDAATDNDDDNDETTGDVVATPTLAFDEFNASAVTVSFDGDEITIVSNALPNHTSPYWSANDDLYIDPIVADEESISPGNITEASYTLTVPTEPELASTSTETGLGAIGISVTGVPIYNQSEGPTDVTEGTASGFDWSGGHSGPTGYHYHVEARDVGETSPLTIDDDELLGIMSDGFLIYGRKCNSIGDYPIDGDASNGHYATTQHSTEEFYHYHIVNEIYLNTYYLLFGVDLQGTQNAIM
ncbi:YHYH protein [Reichenbachiella faecimaris]|uniref:YHYH protein n=1 Tax=Reichenbachiella faecimaris TaxID=692418 RepID=A0A1W2G7I5_REIFA|nr:YHYH protein [Reichenbachiella faecimaris]SMD32256.1 YHYH protein [Reichenbachiella faecimaris]